MRAAIVLALAAACSHEEEPRHLAEIQTTVVDDSAKVTAATSACAGGTGTQALLRAWLDGAELSGAPDAAEPPTADLARGKTLYAAHCAACHGDAGKGDGAAGQGLAMPPRDLTAGTYQLRTTETGELPTDADLFATITRGIHGTAMPPWIGLPPADRWALVAYVKSLSTAFSDDSAPPPIAIGTPPPATPDLIAKGKALFATAGCTSCHGDAGKGDGAAAVALPVKPRDLTGSAYHRGSSVEDVFLTISTGLDGSPMASFAKMVPEADRWAIATYVHSIAAPYQPGPNGLLCPATPREVPDEKTGIKVQARGMK